MEIRKNIEEEEQDASTVSLLVKQADRTSTRFMTNVENGGVPVSNVAAAHFTSVLASSAFVAGSGAFTYGFVNTYSAPTESHIIEDLSLTLQEYSVFGSILTLGGLMGALLSGKMTDLFGRKCMTWILVTVYMVGWLVLASAKNAWLLDLGRLILGIGTGIGAYLVPVYFAEVAPKNLRGVLMSVVMLMTSFGISFGFLIGRVVHWRTLALIGIVPCLLHYFGLFFIPESPRWLAKNGREKEFEAALRQLRGKNVDISDEATDIKGCIDALQCVPSGGISDLFQRKNAYLFMVGIGLMVLQQSGGLNGYSFYTDAIFHSAGIPSGVGFIAVSAIQNLLSVMSVVLIDRCGRRPILLVAVSGTFLGSFLTGFSFHMQGINKWKEVTPILALISVMVYMGSYGFGMGGVPWIILSEILPINIKGLAGSICNVVAYVCAWIVSFTFQFLLDWSSAGTFFIYAVINGLGVIFVATLIPETKGRTLEEIHASIGITQQ